MRQLALTYPAVPARRSGPPRAPQDQPRANGSTNRLLPCDRVVHDWYRFVLSYPPHLVREYAQKFRLGTGARVLDPFCGTGTTLVECRKMGMDVCGVEANPIAHFATLVKLRWDVEPDRLRKHAEKVARAVLRQLESEGVSDTNDPLFNRRSPVVRLSTLPQEENDLLLRNSISAKPCHKALRLRQELHQQHDARVIDHEKLALAKTLVFSASNLRFGPEVGVCKPKEDAPVVGPWLENIRAMSDDLKELQPVRGVSVELHLADAREVGRLPSRESVDAVITSPPYPNEKDYTRATRLESVFLGFIRSKAELQALKRNLIRSNTRGVYKTDSDDLHVAQHQEIHRIAAAIEARRIEMGKTSGFERLYARVARLYFGGMFRHLAELRPLLRPGARLAYVVGDQASYLQVMIRTGQLLAGLADSLGYQVEGLDLFRSRFATATGDMLREEVVVMKWPGTQPRRMRSKSHPSAQNRMANQDTT